MASQRVSQPLPTGGGFFMGGEPLIWIIHSEKEETACG